MADILFKCFEKAVSSQTQVVGIFILIIRNKYRELSIIMLYTQVNSLIEGLSIACLLLKLSSQPELENRIKLGQFWNIILDMNRAIFVSEKLLTQGSEDGK